MGKFTDLETDVFSVFNSAAWKLENVKTIPSNYLSINSGNEFISVNVIAGGESANISSVSGVLVIDIFIPAGNGPRAASLIADKLDRYLVGKSIFTGQSGATQFSSSALAHRGLDTANSSLHRSTYSVKFNYFGVL